MAKRFELAKKYTEKYKDILVPCKYCGNTEIVIASDRHFFGDNKVYWSVCCSTHACDCTGDYVKVKDAVVAWNNKHIKTKGDYNMEHNNTKYNIRDFYGHELTVQPRLELYSVRDFMGKEMPGLAIVLVDVTNEIEPVEFCMLTVSFGEFIGMKNCAYIDSNNCDFTDQLLAQGMATATGFTKHSGFCVYPLWAFTEESLKAMGAENYTKYSTAYDEYMSQFCADDADEEGETV